MHQDGSTMPARSNRIITQQSECNTQQRKGVKFVHKALSLMLLGTAVTFTGCSQTTTPSTASSAIVDSPANDQQTVESTSAYRPKPKEILHKDTLQGYATKEYTFSVNSGQHVKIYLKSDNLSNYFNVAPVEGKSAIFIGSLRGADFEQTFTQAGDYKVLVYLMRNAARRDEKATFELSIRLSGQLPPQGPKPMAKARMHPSWDEDGDGINDCEKDGSCDHTVDYTEPRP